jgi:hypothetical protein
LAGGCQLGASALPVAFVAGGFVSVVNEGLCGGEEGVTLEIVIKNAPAGEFA